MATTTAHFPWVAENTVGTTGYKVRYRLTNTSVWTEETTSGTTIALSGLLINRIYDFEVENVNNTDNPVSAMSQGMNITDPGPLFSPVATSVSYSFANLSSDIDQYSTTIALFTSPGTIIATHILTPASTVTDTFTGLTASTKYTITITPAANQFYKQFTYTVTTLSTSTCPQPLNPTATLV